MKVSILLIIVTLLGIVDSNGQTKKHYHAGTVENQNKITLTLNAPAVSCRINPTYSMHAVNVFGYPESDNFDPIAEEDETDEVRNITLNFEEAVNESLSTSLSARVMNTFSSRAPEKPWYIYLSRSTPFDLELNYGMGSSSVDLSGLAVEKFKINTGSAEIRVGFDGNVPNKVQMDTLLAKVDLGVLDLNKLDLSRAKEVIAQIGFGKLYMHLTKECKERSNITASVGAGTMEVTFDNMDIPVIIRLNNSPLCRIKMLKAFKEIEPETFVNKAYHPNASNLVSFDIDVAMGNVVFKINE